MARMLACLCLCAFATVAGAADYYRWTDANGITHFTDKPPVGVSAEKLKSNSRPTPAPSTPAPKAETEGAKAERQARCETERERLATLKDSRSVQIRLPNGELKQLSPAEQREEISFTEKSIEVYCNYLK